MIHWWALVVLIVSLGFFMHSMSSANNNSLLLSQFGFLLFSFSSLIAWLEFTKVYWIKVMRVKILFFLILEETLSVFHCWDWYLLWICRIWPLLSWGRFPLCSLSDQFLIINEGWILSKAFLCNYWDGHIYSFFFILQLFSVVYHID